ncbi:MAG: hypothetical protein ACRDT6_16480 [Micromonosporaceae bacterium]
MLFEIGRRVQAVSLVMRKHKILAAQQVCECGRLATRTIPAFGLRCDVASQHWDLAHATMRRFLTQLTTTTDGCRDGRPIGRATVRPARHGD